jgi:hypothetical protein
MLLLLLLLLLLPPSPPLFVGPTTAAAVSTYSQSPDAGQRIGLLDCAVADVWGLDHGAGGGADDPAAPLPLRLHGSWLCVGWAKLDCDGLCLVTQNCTSASSPRWVIERSAGGGGGGASCRLRSTSGGICSQGCCMDFESQVQHLQALPVCRPNSTDGNQAWQQQQQQEQDGGWKLRALFPAGENRCMGVLPAVAPPASPAVGMALGLASRASHGKAAVFAPFDTAPGAKPQRLQLAGTQVPTKSPLPSPPI